MQYGDASLNALVSAAAWDLTTGIDLLGVSALLDVAAGPQEKNMNIDHTLKCWDIPHTARLLDLLTWCTNERSVNRLLVVHRSFHGAKRRELSRPQVLKRSQELFRGRVLRKSWCNQWPGTVSPEGQALVLVVKFSPTLIKPMAHAGPTLEDWLEAPPNSRPEDLCLYREGDPLPALVSVTHERDAWLLSRQEPSIEGILPSDLKASELLIPIGKPDFLA